MNSIFNSFKVRVYFSHTACLAIKNRYTQPLYFLSIALGLFITVNSQAAQEGEKKHTSPLNRYLASEPKLASNVDNFSNWKTSRFSLFFLNDAIDFSTYDEVILFPMTFDRMKIAETSRKRNPDKWLDSDFNDMDKLCEYFDQRVKRIFNRSHQYNVTLQGGKNVLAIEFRMMNLTPFSTPDTTEPNSGIVANLTVQAVLVESQTGKLVAVIEQQIRIQDLPSSANFTMGVDSEDDGFGYGFKPETYGGLRGNADRAWRKAFKSLTKNLLRDMKRLKKIHQA